MKMLYVNNNDGSSYEVRTFAGDSREKVVLSFSNNECWNPHVRGTVAAMAVDHGNGVTITLEDDFEFNLDYSQIAELEMLLTCLKKDAPWAKQYGMNYSRYELKEE